MRNLITGSTSELFLKDIGRRLVYTGQFEPLERLEDIEEKEFYLKMNNPFLTVPILTGYSEKAEERAFDNNESLGANYKKAGFAKEAVRALWLIKEIVKEEDEDLFNKTNKKIISIGDRANKSRQEYALEGVRYGIDFDAVPFAYNHAEGTLERELETVEWIIENTDFIPNLKENILAIHYCIRNEHSKRIAERLNKQYLKPVEDFKHSSDYRESLEKVLIITRVLHKKRTDLFTEMERHLDRELLAKTKYPNSKIAKIDEGVIVIPKEREKIIVVGTTEKEIITQSA